MSRIVSVSALLGVVVVLGADLPPARVAVDYYLKIKGIEGEAAEGSIGLTGFAWDSRAEVGRFAEYAAPREAASGMATGRRMHKPFTIVKRVDKASPKLMEACANGTHVGDVEVWSRDEGQASLKYTLQDAIISSYSISGPEGPSARPVESLSLTYEQIKLAPARAAVSASPARSN